MTYTVGLYWTQYDNNILSYFLIIVHILMNKDRDTILLYIYSIYYTILYKILLSYRNI